MLKQQQLVYQDHDDEIAFLNRILAALQADGPVPEEVRITVEWIIDRLDKLMTIETAILKDFP